MKSTDQKRRKPIFFSSLTRKIAVLLVAAFVVTSGATFLFWLFLSHTGGLPEKFDELGRQRYRATQMAALAQYEEPGPHQLSGELEAAMDEFGWGVDQLQKDVDNLPITMPSLAELSEEINELWAQMKPQVKLLIGEEVSPQQRQEAREVVVANGLRLAELSDDVIKTYRDGVDRVRARMWWMMVSAVLANLLLLIFGLVMVRRSIVAPLQGLKRAAQDIRSGELQSRVGAHQFDELGAAQRAFDEMAAEIEALVGALEKQHKFAESLIQHAPAGIVVHRNGEVVFGNPELCRLLGVDDIDGVPGRDVLCLFHRDDRDEAAQVTIDVDAPQDHTPPVELRICSCYEDPRTVEVVSAPIEYEEQPAVLTVLRDVTERKLMEAKMMQMDRAIAIGTLVAGVGHEINNPLSFVLANLNYTLRTLSKLREICREAPPEQAQRCRNVLRQLEEALNEAQLGGERIRDIVKQLQQFARYEKSPTEPVDVKRALESAIRMASGEIRHRAKLVRDFDDVPAVQGSESQLAQVFLNLLVNAAQAIEEGDAEHNIITARVASEDNQVVVEISDTGGGIADDVASRIFDPFFTTKSPGHGTGLGLSLSQQLIDIHDGVLTFDTEQGRGTTFRVVLPSTDQEPPEELVEPSSEPTDRSRRVAVVDDEPEMGNVIQRILRRDHQVESFVDSRQFLEVLDGGDRYDIIFCDLMMPNFTGMDVWERVSEEYPQLLSRIVFITGGAFTPRASRFLEEIDPPLLQKPFDPDALREMVAITEPLE